MKGVRGILLVRHGPPMKGMKGIAVRGGASSAAKRDGPTEEVLHARPRGPCRTKSLGPTWSSQDSLKTEHIAAERSKRSQIHAKQSKMTEIAAESSKTALNHKIDAEDPQLRILN